MGLTLCFFALVSHVVDATTLNNIPQSSSLSNQPLEHFTPIPWENCAPHNKSHLKLEVFQMKPDPPKRGHRFKIEVVAQLDEIVNGGSFNQTFWFNNQQYPSTTYDLCEYLEFAHRFDRHVPRCPLTPQNKVK